MKKKRSILTIDLFREIKRSFERFLSIFAIVAIGVAFFAGIKAASSVMKASADAYYDRYNLMDLRILSNFGLNSNDIIAIKNTEGVDGVFATMSMPVTTIKDTYEYVLIAHGIDIKNTNSDNKNYINQYALIEGRYPLRSGECLIEDLQLFQSNLNLGDTITLESGTDKDILSSLVVDTYKIVGIVKTPYYLSYQKGTTNIKDGRIDAFIVIPNSDFISDYYHEIFVTIDGAKAYNSYQSSYFDHIETVVDQLGVIGNIQSEKRYNEIIDEANKKLDEAKLEYQNGLTTYETEIEKAERELEEARFELIRGQIELANNQLLLAITIQSYQSNIDTAKQALALTQQTYDQLDQQYQQTKEQLDVLVAGYEEELVDINLAITQKQAQISEIDDQIANNQQQIDQLNQQLTTTDPADPEYQTIINEISSLNSTNSNLSAQRNTYQSELLTLENRRNQIQTNINLATTGLVTLQQQLVTLQNTIILYQNQITDGEKQLIETQQSANVEFAKAQKKIDDGQTTLINGQLELDRQKQEGKEKLLDAQEQIIKAEKDIAAIAEAQWYILDRNSHYSYRDYGAAADRMDNIAQVFPLFFFLVAALVCSTTMTRMIDEQRGTIGTLKALGYSDFRIISKYLNYALIASIAGCMIGIVSGMYIFPTVIFEVWNTMYTVPDIVYLPNTSLALTTSLIAITTTLLASYSSCYVILKDNPASLLRPKAPVNGKKIILEHLNFLWRRMSFTAKVTARNIFRYKKRFLMTVIGISGCSALLLSGFGIRDSIGQIATYQFEQIISYATAAKFTSNLTLIEKQDYVDELKTQVNVEDAMLISETNGTIYVGNEELAVTIIIPYDIVQYRDFYQLRERTTKQTINIKNSGIVITEKAATDLNLKINDKLTIANSDGYKEQAIITGIAENYVGHYVFMAANYYRDLFSLRPIYNSSIIKLNDTSTTSETQFGTQLIDSGKIDSLTFYSGIADQFKDMITSLNLVVVVMILSAGILAFVVLYNLSNVNISERLREIATIKVLGFTPKEVSNYVYREIIILTFIGSLFGLLLGRILHLFIMKIAELDAVMFGREIYPLSYVYAVVITLVFSLIVNITMTKKLRSIKMVESLKSVE